MNLNLSDVIVLGLATWTLAYIVVKTSGPFNLLGRFRTWAVNRSTVEDKVLSGSLGEMVSCIYCTGIWVAIAVFIISQTPLMPVLYPFAIAGAGLMLWRYTGGDFSK